MPKNKKQTQQFFLNFEDLEKEQKVQLKNSLAAVRVWKQLKSWGVPQAGNRLKKIHKKHEALCASYCVDPVFRQFI